MGLHYLHEAMQDWGERRGNPSRRPVCMTCPHEFPSVISPPGGMTLSPPNFDFGGYSISFHLSLSLTEIRANQRTFRAGKCPALWNVTCATSPPACPLYARAGLLEGALQV